MRSPEHPRGRAVEVSNGFARILLCQSNRASRQREFDITHAPQVFVRCLFHCLQLATRVRGATRQSESENKPDASVGGVDRTKARVLEHVIQPPAGA
jgi:hypothetical protein